MCVRTHVHMRVRASEHLVILLLLYSRGLQTTARKTLSSGPWRPNLSTENNYGNLRVSCQDQPPLTWTLCFYRIKIEARSSALCFPTCHYIAKPYLLLTFSTSVHSQWDDNMPSSGGVFKWFAACSRLDYFDHSLPVAVDHCDEEVLVSVSIWLRKMLHSILFSDNFLRIITYQCV